jgi:hypothetical protein
MRAVASGHFIAEDDSDSDGEDDRVVRTFKICASDDVRLMIKTNRLFKQNEVPYRIIKRVGLSVAEELPSSGFDASLLDTGRAVTISIWRRKRGHAPHSADPLVVQAKQYATEQSIETPKDTATTRSRSLTDFGSARKALPPIPATATTRRVRIDDSALISPRRSTDTSSSELERFRAQREQFKKLLEERARPSAPLHQDPLPATSTTLQVEGGEGGGGEGEGELEAF